MRKVPVEIDRRQSADGEWGFFPKLPLSSLVEVSGSDTNLRVQAEHLTQQYRALVGQAAQAIDECRKQRTSLRRADPRKYWDIGDAILKFLRNTADAEVFVNGLYAHLQRDLKLSRSSLEKFLLFRRRVPTRGLVNPEVSWKRYRSSLSTIGRRAAYQLPLPSRER